MNQMSLPQPGKKWAFISLSMAVVSILMIILSTLGTFGYNHISDSKLRDLSNTLAEIFGVLFVLTTFIGLIVGIVALVKNIRNPAVYGARALTIVAAVLNFLLFCLGCLVLFVMVFFIYLMNL